MSKKKSWFARVKDFLFPGKDDTKEQLKNNKKKKKKKPVGLKRITKNPYSLEVPSLSKERTEINATTQVAHQTLPVASPASSEETGASGISTNTNTNCSISLPTTSSSSKRQCDEYSASKILLRRAQLVQHVEHLAAIKIQTSFRGYLARKALRALRGLVRLQAMIRGRAVRRQAVATLKSLQSIVNIQSQVCAIRYQKSNEYKQNEDPRYVKLKSIQRRRDHTLLIADQENGVLLSKTEAMMRRNKLKAYSFNHRHSADTEDVRMIGRLRHWLEVQDKDELPMKEEIKRVDTIRLRNKQPIMLNPRSSYDSRKLRSTSHLRNKLEAKPAYMAATESARARSRRMESYSDGDSPYKSKLSPMSTYVSSERNCGGGLLVSGSCSRQRESATGFKGIGGSLRFNRNMVLV